MELPDQDLPLYVTQEHTVKFLLLGITTYAHTLKLTYNRSSLTGFHKGDTT